MTSDHLGPDDAHVGAAIRRRRAGRACLIVASLALFAGACSEDGESPLDGSLPDLTLPDGGGDTGGGDAGGGDAGGGDAGGGDAGGGDAGGGDAGGGDAGGGYAGGGDTGAAPAPSPVPPEDDGLSTEEWILLVLLAVAGVAIIIGAVSAASSHSAKKEARRADVDRKLRELTSGCRWVNDSGTMSVLESTTADQLRGTWSTVRAHMIDLEAKTATLAGSTGDSALDQSLAYLGQSLAGLRGAVEANVNARLRPDANQQEAMIAASTQTVMQRRQQLESALNPVWAAQR